MSPRPFRARLVALLLTAIASSTLSCLGGPLLPVLPEAQAGRPQTLLLISVPGFAASHLAPDEDGRIAMPTAAALASRGASATRVQGVMPAAHYPAHASLLTGRIPAEHGILSDHPIGDFGVRTATYAHASALRTPTLWQRVSEAGGTVASLDWPSTQGAEIAWLVPDVPTLRRGQSWLEALDGATPLLRSRLAAHGGPDVGAAGPDAEKDAALVGVACEIVSGPSPPSLVMLRLGQTRAAWSEGPGSAAAAAAFRGADDEIARLLRCLDAADRLDRAALAIVGAHGVAAVHTAAAPNAVLVERGLRPSNRSTEWRALARSNGGTAFVYAKDERAAIAARVALAAAAEESGAFRVIPAAEMLETGGDPEAWFGLEAFPGFVFVDRAEGPLLGRSPLRGASGYLPKRASMDTAFVAWGRGIRAGIRIPEMRETDAGPTLARLLSVQLEGGDGRSLVGLLADGG